MMKFESLLTLLSLLPLSICDEVFGLTSVKQFPTPCEGDTYLRCFLAVPSFFWRSSDCSVFGSDLSEDANVKVGLTSCSKTLWFSSTKIKCLVPPGVGADLAVIVDDGSRHVEMGKAFSCVLLLILVFLIQKNLFFFSQATLHRTLCMLCQWQVLSLQFIVSYFFDQKGSKMGQRLMQLRGYDFGTYDSKPSIRIGSSVCLEVKIQRGFYALI